MNSFRRGAAVVAIAAAGLAAGTPRVAAAQTVLTFESGVPCDNATPLGIVQGVDFLGQWRCYGFVQAPYTAQSGTNRIYPFDPTTNDNAAAGTFRFASPSVFNGAYLAGDGTTVGFTLFLGGAIVGSSSMLTTTATPTFLASGYAGTVDRVTVTGSSTHYVLDDLTFRSAATTTAPEPATFALVGVGMLALGGLTRRTRRRPS